MAHRQRQRHAAVFQGQRAALAQVITAFPQVDIAVAHPRRTDLQQHLRPLRGGRGLIHFLQGFAEVDDAIALHGMSPLVILMAGARRGGATSLPGGIRCRPATRTLFRQAR
ncbi:hypothetical protein G6F51_014578 [Rhizopus arrhizus]|uniref:Uncharacterized protein n=1 Tax=Rhizopus oryzae TaxID=64495 RepID=A0A9P7BYS6_RHIOR|nr:hypothetical protein G6F51_014578 [Rhizopus arrhizus]